MSPKTAEEERPMRNVTRRDMLRGLIGAAGLGVITACAGNSVRIVR